MKKKILVVLLVALIVLPLAAAAPKLDIGKAAKGHFGLGVNLGTTSGLSFKWDNKTWDLYANLGTNFDYGNSVGIEAGAEFPVTTFKINNEPFDVNVGFMVPLFIGFGNNASSFDLGFFATAGIGYEFRKVPIQLFTRIGLGLRLLLAPEFSLKFDGSGTLGFVYLF